MTVRRHVLVLHASDEPYGSDRVLLEIVTGLSRRGWTFTVLLPDDREPGWLSRELAATGVAFQRVALAVARRRYFHPPRLLAYLRSLRAARAVVRREARRVGASVIHVNTSALLVGALVGRPGRARLVWHIHEIVVHPRPIAWLFRALPTLTADRVVAVSDAVRGHLWPSVLAGRRAVTIHNGLPARRRSPHPAVRARGPVIAYVGRLNAWKGYEVFIEAATSVAAHHPDVSFVLAGDPPPGEEWRVRDLEERARTLADRLQVLGAVADGASVLEAADIAVVPSTLPDPLPTVVLEAMRAGCAVVASRHGGALEMIVHGESGLLVEPGDPVDLARALTRLLDDPAYRRALGAAAARRFGTEFTVERMLDQIEAVYLEAAR